jgi:hypothetical protein
VLTERLPEPYGYARRSDSMGMRTGAQGSRTGDREAII